MNAKPVKISIYIPNLEFLALPHPNAFTDKQDRIKAGLGPSAVPNAGHLQTYNQLTTPIDCGAPKLRAQVLQYP